jgi:hypothetical protein
MRPHIQNIIPLHYNVCVVVYIVVRVVSGTGSLPHVLWNGPQKPFDYRKEFA